VRAHGLADQWDERRRAAILRLVQVPILALRARPAENWRGNPDLPRLPTDAARRELQSGCRQSGDGEKDGRGRGGKQRHWAVKEKKLTAGGAKKTPAAPLHGDGQE